MKHELIFHLHIPKTAGSSVRTALIDSGWVLANGFNKHSLSKRQGNLISGHFKFGAFPRFRISNKTTYVTVLREPELLMISMYRFVKNRPKHPFYCLADEGFDQFWKGRVFKNMQARYLAGRLASLLYGKGIICDNLLYRVAARNLERIDFVGVQSNLEALFSEMKRKGAIDSGLSSFEHRNVGFGDKPKFGDQVDNFKLFNQVDYRIYRLACEMVGGST
jgi:hypothetical protein